MQNPTLRLLLLLSVLGLALRSAAAQPITIQTSDTLAALGRSWAEGYKARQADAVLEVTNGTTSAVFSALAGKKINLALTARAIRYKEAQPCVAVFGQRPTEVKIGVNGVAVYVHADNPIKEVMYEDLEAIFTGKYKTWKRLGGKDAPIVAYGMATNTAAGELFKEEVLNGKDVSTEVHIATEEELMNAIAGDPNSIGFAPLRHHEGVRTVNIKRVYSSTPVEPTEENISNRIYPISRFLYFYLDPAANQGDIKAYLVWLRSDEGQAIAKQAGFYPLATKWRATP